MKKLLSLPLLALGAVMSSCSSANGDGAAGNADVGSLMSLSALMAVGIILVAFVVAAVFYRMENGRWSRFWRFVERHLTLLFLLTWVFGFCIYTVGMFIVTDDAAGFTVDSFLRLLRQTPMGVVHAFGMFVMDSDISAVHEEFHSNLLFMTLFSLAHFMAAAVSMLFVIKHFGYNLMARVQLWATGCSGAMRERLFIFWGINEPSYLLAADIRRTLKAGTYRLVFVKTADDGDETSAPTGLDRLFDFLSLKNRELDHLKELNCLTATAFARLSRCELTAAERKDGTQVLAGKLALGQVARLIGKTRGELHFFMLGDDQESNLRATANICADSDIRRFAEAEGHKVTIYSHARYDSASRVVEDAYSSSNLDVKIVDSSHASIDQLKSTPDYHPIRFVELDTTRNVGTVSSPFTSLVVGFGESGQDAVRYLHEFGAFVSSLSSVDDDQPGSDNTNRQVMRSGYHCHVVDAGMDQLKGRFLSSAPALDGEGSRDLYSFHDSDISSPDFYSLLDEVAATVNYVVVALGDSEQSISAAVNIFNYVRRNRVDISRFKIFVRSYSSYYEPHMRDIADHYNQVGTPAFAEHIVIFGSAASIYTFGNIVESRFEAEGRLYNRAYCTVNNRLGTKDEWALRREILLGRHTLEAYGELRRKEMQDVENAYHAFTKLYIIERVCADNGALSSWFADGRVPKFGRISAHEHLLEGIVEAQGDYSAPDSGGHLSDSGDHPSAAIGYNAADQLLFRNLARLEHLRWNGSHEALGYRYYGDHPTLSQQLPFGAWHSCNERYRLHNCLMPWEALDAESLLAGWDDATKPDGRAYPDYKLYDFVVVTTTINNYFHSHGQNQV